MKRKQKISIALTLIGACLGYLYYLKIGCLSGSCAITSNPYVSVLYGALFGFLLSVFFDDKKDTTDS